MLTTVKLPKELHAALEKAARTHGLTKSEVLRAALRAELARLAGRRRPTPHDLGKDLFGKARSGRNDLSTVRARDLLAGRAGSRRGRA
jgi:Arc/MetJ-type ribon-helix-helix transcriptional regulator